MPSPKAPPPKKSRQSDYVARKRAAGYVPLSSVFVPKEIAEECRQLVRNRVEDYESKLAYQF